MTKRMLVCLTLLLLAGSAFAGKTRIAVAEFEAKIPKAHGELGTSMADLLINALVETKMYSVLERTALEQVRKEQNLGNSGAVDPATAAQLGRLLGAQYLVIGAVTQFEEKTGGGGIGAVVGRKAGGLGFVSAKVGITVRVVNSTTGEIIASENVEQSSKGVGVAAGAVVKGIPVGGTLFKSKSMQDALEGAIDKAVKFLSKEIPGQSEGVSDASLITLNVDGVNFSSLKNFAGIVEGLKGVEDVSKSLSGGAATVKVRYAGTSEELADALYNSGNGAFEITGLSENSIDLKVK